MYILYKVTEGTYMYKYRRSPTSSLCLDVNEFLMNTKLSMITNDNIKYLFQWPPIK